MTLPGSMVKGALECRAAPRQAHHCESHLTCELPFPMTDAILSNGLCPWRQRSGGTTVHLGCWMGLGPGARWEVQGRREKRGFTIVGSAGARPREKVCNPLDLDRHGLRSTENYNQQHNPEALLG